MTQFASILELSSLDGSNGFVLLSGGVLRYTGASVSSGDVNGDGLADLIVSESFYGRTFVVFGSASGFGPTVALSSLDGSNGFRIDPVEVRGYGERAVASGGDVNGDGFDDVIIGAYPADSEGGASYVVFGKASGFDATLALSSLDGNNGFRIEGASSGAESGWSVSSAGDVNGDGFADLVIGAPGQTDYSYSGMAFVVFGKASPFAATLEVSDLDGSNGFTIDGVAAYDKSGFSVSSAGDLNGDGFADLVIGAPGADPHLNYGAGSTYVVFGKASGFGATLELSSLNGSNGFRIDGVDGYSYSGRQVSSAGDVNGDGFADLIIGARYASRNGYHSGSSYVVFGKAGGFPASLSVASLNGSNGFRIDGIATNDQSGWSVSAAGDVNGDGFADLIVGAPYANPNGSHSGASYVVFGKASGFGATLELSSLDGENGFRIRGVAADDRSGYSVSAGGDVNGDGFADLIVGAPGNGNGAVYVIYGHAPDEAVTRVGTAIANAIRGGSFDDVLLGRDGDDQLFGAGGNDRLNGGGGDDTLDAGDGNDTLISGKGTDVLLGGDGDDSFNVGKWLRPDDSLDGGNGYDVLKLNGDYSFGLRFAPTTIANIEAIKVHDGFSYDLRFDDANVAAGQTLVVSGLKLTGANMLSVDGSAETDGSFKLYGGAGDDQLTGGAQADALIGGAGDDVLQGGAGADVLTGGAGSDTFVYRTAGDSLGNAPDRITDFDATSDRIDLWFSVAAIDTTETAATLAALPTVFDAAHLGQYHAALAEIGTHTYLVIDANGVAGYQASADLLIRVDGLTGTLSTANFG